MKQFWIYSALACAAIWIMLLVFAKPHVGFYYPYADDLTIYEQSQGSVGSFQDCRWWAYKLHQNTTNTDAVYACGSRCEYNSQQEIYVCKNMTKIKPIDVL